MLGALIAALSPAWALRRAAARRSLRSLEASSLSARAYDAASHSDRRLRGWRGSLAGPNAEAERALSVIRARCRDLARNDAWAATAIRKLADLVVGTGITPVFQPEDDEPRSERAERLSEAVWREFSESSDPQGCLDFAGQLRLAARCLFESGEVLLWMRNVQPRGDGDFPLRIEVLEPDWLDESYNRQLTNGNTVIQGVELTPSGERVAYWLHRAHPGEWFRTGGAGSVRASVTGEAERVPAGDVCHVFDPLRPGQIRGVPLLAPVVTTLKQLQELSEAELVRRQVAACLTAVVKQHADRDSLPLAGRFAGTDPDGARLEVLEPGAFVYMRPGEEAQFPTLPNPPEFGQSVSHYMRAVASATGLTYSQLSGDLASANYSSLRSGMVEAIPAIEHWQWNVMVPMALRPIFRRVRQAAILTGRDILPCEWTMPRRRWVDPEKEVAGNVMAIRAGFRTLGDVIAEDGYDPRRRLRELAREQAELDRLGLKLDSDPRQSSSAQARGEVP